MLRQLAQETGGRAFFPAKIEELNGVYAQIADELASQYTLGYTSKNSGATAPGGASSCRSTAPTCTPRTKKGLYAPTSR